MLSLTRIFLHHWHRFYATVIDVDGGLCLTGPDDSDSAAVLDALQFALIGDPARVRFTSTRYGFTHDLDTYTRGRLAEDKWLRSGSVIAYVILEFSNTLGNQRLAVGQCIETASRLAPEITHFILPEPLSPATFVTNGRPLPRIELKPLLRNWRGAQHFDTPLDYQTELLKRLGGLDEKFVELIQRALRFTPARRADEFAAAWFFDAHPLDVSLLRRLRERLAELRAEHDRIERQIAALQPIIKGQTDLSHHLEQRDAHTVLLSTLHAAAAARRIAALESQLAALQSQLSAEQAQYASAQTAHTDLERQLREAERVEFEHGLAHRRSILQWQNRYAAQTADNIRERWLALQRQIKTEADGLRPLLKTSALELDELAALKKLLDEIDADTTPGLASQNEPPPPTLAAAIDSATPALLAAHNRIAAERTRLADQIANATQQIQQLKLQLDPLTTEPPNPPTTPPHIARMQEILTPVLGKKPPLLYEFIDVPDARWQNAVEAMLGPCRFHAIVSATWHGTAKSALLAARATEDLGDADVHDPTQQYNRPAHERSLAKKVETIYPDLRAYLDHLLGGIITCNMADELRFHPRAVTPEVTLHSEWQLRSIPPAEYQPIVIGKHAARLQAEARQRQIHQIESQIGNQQSAIGNQQSALNDLDAILARLSRGHALAALRRWLSEPLDERPARGEAAAFEAELRGLDLASLNERSARAAQLRESVAAQSRVKDEISRRAVALEFELRAGRNELSAARIALDRRNAEAASTQTQFPSASAAADEMSAQFLNADDLAESIRSVEAREREFDKKARDERLRLIEAISAFNAVYQLSKWPGEPTDTIYAQANQRLNEIDLPRLKAQIAAAEEETAEELRDHIARPLRERLANARRTLEGINDALAELGAAYRLVAEPALDTKDFYSLITDQTQTPTQAQTLGRFYEIITTHPDSVERLTDYRRYLEYRIEAHGSDGTVARLAHADDEAQIAFYMIIAASFAQVYRIRGDRVGRPCIRLAPFGLAFAQMEAAQIAPTLDLFRRIGLQTLTAAPLERSDTLAANLPSTVVLMPVSNTVMAEPYRNFAALPT